MYKWGEYGPFLHISKTLYIGPENARANDRCEWGLITEDEKLNHRAGTIIIQYFLTQIFQKIYEKLLFLGKNCKISLRSLPDLQFKMNSNAPKVF
jgi:hypothetical protein